MSADTLIVGAGIGGLAAAICLHRAGVRVRVFESAERLQPLGVGINLLPHSVRVLAGLGLLDELRATAIETASLEYYNRHGQRIWSEPRGIAAGYPVPQFSVHRGELQMILARAAERELGSGRIVPGHHFASIEQSGSGVRARFLSRPGGEVVDVEGSALVAADGIHSALRRIWHPKEGPPRYAKRLLWRATTLGIPVLGGRTMIMAGHERQKFVCYPISKKAFDAGESLINWIAELWDESTMPPRDDWNREVDRSKFRAAFADWRFPCLDVPAIIDGARTVYEFPMVDRDPLATWTRGRATLLGDAAHPMYPIGSNGASQAILDADCLARSYRAGGTVEEVFARYDAERRPATAAIVLANRGNGPEQVMQLAEVRAPLGFERVGDIFAPGELEEIAARYKATAGFALAQVRSGA